MRIRSLVARAAIAGTVGVTAVAAPVPALAGTDTPGSAPGVTGTAVTGAAVTGTATAKAPEMAPAAVAPELFDVTWVAQAVIDDDVVTVSGSRQGSASIRLDGEGGIVGTLGCGVFHGPVTVTPDTLAVGPLHVTDQAVMFCLLADSVLGRPLLGVLDGTVRYVLRDGLLYLSRPGGPVVVLKATPPVVPAAP